MIYFATFAVSLTYWIFDSLRNARLARLARGGATVVLGSDEGGGGGGAPGGRAPPPGAGGGGSKSFAGSRYGAVAAK